MRDNCRHHKCRDKVKPYYSPAKLGDNHFSDMLFYMAGSELQEILVGGCTSGLHQEINVVMSRELCCK